MVLAGGFIQFPVVYAHTPPGDNSCLKKFIVVTLYDRCASFLGYHMDGADLLAIRDRVDNACVKQFQHFFTDYLLQVGIQSSLRFTGQLLVIFHVDSVHANGGADSFDVVDGVTDGFLVRPELREELIGFSFVEVRANDHRVRLVGSKELIAKVFWERFEVKLRSLRLFLPQA